MERRQGRGEEAVTSCLPAEIKVTSDRGHAWSCWFLKVKHIWGLWRGSQHSGGGGRGLQDPFFFCCLLYIYIYIFFFFFLQYCGLAIRFLYDIIHVLMPFSQIIPPLPLPQSPKDCSIHLCLFCCLAYRVVITNFLNSIYMH